MSDGDKETDLIREAVAGDCASLSELLLIHYDGLYRHISTRISRDLQGLIRPDDVLHQTFVRAAQSIGKFEVRQKGAFRAWLRTIAENLVKDAEKRRRRERRARPRGRGAAGFSGASSLIAMVERLAGESTTPSGRVQRQESVRCMLVALASLPTEQREVIERHYMQNQTFEQIGLAMNRTKDAIRGICYRARRNLRAAMGRSSLYFSG